MIRLGKRNKREGGLRMSRGFLTWTSGQVVKPFLE